MCACVSTLIFCWPAPFVVVFFFFWFSISTKTQNKKDSTLNTLLSKQQPLPLLAYYYWLWPQYWVWSKMSVIFITCSAMLFSPKSVAYSTQSSDKEQMVISHVVHMFWWQVISWIAIGHDFVDRRLAELQLVMTLSTGDWLNHVHDFVDRRLAESHLVMTLSTGGWIAADDNFVDRRLAEMWSGWVHKHCSSYSLIGDQYMWTLYIIVIDYNHCCCTGLSIFPLLSWDGLWLTGHGEKKSDY